ncbi:glycosyltransferase [bacterium]|nr:glycosyltransferase [bacterium]
MPLLSACLIVRDEEASLERCLDSLTGLAEDIVVGITCPDNRTASLAHDRGARIIEVPWEHDFSKARNAVLPQASGRWIFSIDADEWVICENITSVRSLLAGKNGAGWQVYHRPLTDWTPYRTLRIFPNNPALRFEGIIHESVFPSLRRLLHNDAPEFGILPLTVLHDGYEGDQTSKHTRYLPLLARELERDPGNANNHRHYALCLRTAGDTRGADIELETALSIVRGKSHPSAADIVAFTDAIELARERNTPVRPLIDEAASLFTENPFVIWYQGLEFMREGRHAEAVPCFERLISWGETGTYDKTMSYPEKLFGDYAREALGESVFLLGDYRRGKDCYKTLLDMNPEKIEYRVKYDLCTAKLRKTEKTGDG